MNILDKYVLRRFFSVLFGSMFSFILIVFVVDFIERGWHLMQKYDVGFNVMGWYYINYLPFYIILSFPVAMLVSTLFSIGSLAKNHELVIMKASGISLYRIMAPILGAAFVLSLGVMLFGEFVLTRCETTKEEIKVNLIEKRPSLSKVIRSNVKVPGQNGWILLAKTYEINSKTAQDVKAHRIADNMIIKTYIAQQMISSDSGWVLVNGNAQQSSTEFKDSLEHFFRFDTLWAPFLTQTPEMLEKSSRPPRQTDFFELRKQIEVKKQIGEPVQKDQVELALKITFPFASFILVLIGAPLAANPRRSGPSVGFGISIIISFIFFVLVRIGQSLGNNGKLPPFLAASLGEIVFLAIGIIMLAKARK